ncbi:MAG: hypothetical protein KAS16_08390 [Thermoplasmata archaeon]|nr:hypothetical protein [Thermoplasmata archaeon]
MKVKTGIEGLDEITMGGVVENSIVLLSGCGGAGKTILASQFLINNAAETGEKGLFITMEEGRSNIINSLPSGLRKTLDENENKVWFLDLSTIRQLSAPDAGKDDIASSVLNVEIMIEIIETWVREKGISRLVLDGIASFGLLYEKSTEFRNALFRIVSKLKSLHITTIITTEINDQDRLSRLGVEEFVTDAIIRITRINGRRYIEVLKMRGSDFISGKHSCEITDAGARAFPILNPISDIPKTDTKISTGIKGLDNMSDGGYYRGDAILVSGSAGTGKTTMALQFIDEAARNGKKAIYIGFEENPMELKRNAAGFGIDLEGYEEKGLVKIMHSTSGDLDPNKHAQEISRSLEGVERVVIDTISDYGSISHEAGLKNFLNTLIILFKNHNITSLMTVETDELMGITNLSSQGTSSNIVDGIIMLRYVEIGSEMKKALNILKLRGTKHKQEIKEYDITSAGIVIEEKFVGMEGVLTGSPRKSMTDRVEKFFD